MADTETIETPGIGHNRPPASVPDPKQIVDSLLLEQYALLRRKGELLAALERMPGEVLDRETEQKMTDFGSQIAAAIKAADAARVDSKEPYLTGGRAVDAFFGNIIDPLLRAKKTVGDRLTVYKRRREDEERARRQAELEARRRAEEAARLEAEERARQLRKESDLKAAVEAEQEAKRKAEERAQAQRDADAKAASLTGSRGDLGGHSSLRTTWDFRDLDRARLDLEALRMHVPMDGLEKAVRSYIKAGGRKLAGVEIYERKETVIR